MRSLKILLLGAIALLAFGCEGSDIDPGGDDLESFIIIRNASTDVTVSTPDNKGAINLEIGDTRDFEVIRTVQEQGQADVVTDVTNDVDVNFTDTDVASMGADGILTAGPQAGFTTMSVKFRDDDGDPSDDDTVDLDITVTDPVVNP